MSTETATDPESAYGPCPKCGSKTGFFQGYGLMGGGCGPYEGCDDCDYWHKTEDEE